ncbi:MAG: DUF1549 domain-containing protein [Chthonomonadales bacterium]
MDARTVVWCAGVAIVLGSPGLARSPGSPSVHTGASRAAPRSKPVPPFYALDVAPLVQRLGCARASCHGGTRGAGRLKLSLFGGDPKADRDGLAQIEAALGRDAFLQKFLGGPPHTKEPPAGAASREYRILDAWIAAGMPFASPGAAEVTKIQASPQVKAAAPGSRMAITVTAILSNGTHRDVTRNALYWSTDPAVASVDAAGVVTFRRPGDAWIVAQCFRRNSLVHVLVPQKLPFAFPSVRPFNHVDELCLAQLRRLGIPPAPLAGDAEFLRRAYLVVAGRLPRVEEVRAFLQDRSPKKRSRLVDQLLAGGDFADFWALKWADILRIKSEYPVRLWPKATQAYYRWLRESIAQNKPFDRFAQELITARGSNFRSGPANFYRAVVSRDPQTLAETASVVFMGVRLGCARCHVHPYENWSRTDDLGMAAFFAGMRYKSTQEWKEEIVYCAPDAVLRDPDTKDVVAPRFLGWTHPLENLHGDPRERFAQWLTAPENPWFAREICNRIWAWVMGRGLVDEPDDLRPSNPPTNGPLLDYLAKELVSHRFDTRHVFRLILNSRIFQLSSVTNRWNAFDTRHYSHWVPRRMAAEELLDAICAVTGSNEVFSSIIPEPFTHLPKDTRAVQVADGSISTPFLDAFGRPARNSPFDSERCTRPSMRQASLLVNSADVEGKIAQGRRAAELAAPGKSEAGIVEDLYLTALSRFPTLRERRAAIAYLKRGDRPRLALVQDLMWALINTRGFMTIE